MTDTEFLSRLPEGARIPTEGEFETIQFVYNYHPAIHPSEGKDQIARLYSEFGMRIIMDMLDTAQQAEMLESERRQLKARLREIEQEEQELAML